MQEFGGITGWDSGKLINHCYTKVNIIASSTTGNGGLIGGPNGATPEITNSLSLSTGKGYRISGFNVLSNVSNVYEYSESNAVTNINDTNSENVKTITDLYNKAFYKDVLGFDEDIWNLDLVENENLPKLKSDPMPNELEYYEVLKNKNNIPNYKEVRKNSNYKSSKEILYYNMSKIMPFADTASWIEYGNSIPNTNLMATQKIKFILALNENNELISGIQNKNISDIKKIKVVYENDESTDFTVEYSKKIDNIVAVYKIKELNLQYQFNDYISNIDDNLLNELVEKANKYDYSEKIAAITTEEESRLYVDYYNESVKSNIKDIIENYMMTNENFATYNSKSFLQKEISNSMSEELLIKLLYSYNYIDKWYHIDLDGVILSDFMFFEGTNISDDMIADNLITSICQTSENNRKTNNTATFYSNILQSQIGKTLQDFLAYMMKTINGYDNPSDWFAEHFDGILVEQEAYGGSDEIKYRIWDIMSYRNHLMLPILTAPQEDMYIISMPSQLVIGSMNRYSTYLTKDGEERDRMEKLIREYSEKIGHFYGTIASIVSNSTTQLNAMVHIQYDTRFYFPESDKADAGTQAAGTTRDPVIKWVYEAVGGWGAANGSGAYANGTDIYWICFDALSYFNTFTHETAHNQDGRIFYGGAGRRANTSAETHANGNITQEWWNGNTVFNLTYDLTDYTGNAVYNFSYNRINSPSKIQSYYKEIFEIRYVLDYLEAQAFLKLTPEEQAKIAVQATETTEVTTSAGIEFSSTKYSKLTADDFKKMNLKTIEDLWDNQLCIRNAGNVGIAQGYSDAYGFESYFVTNWYQPHNDNGICDTHSIKRLGKEMLGYAGYEDGYVIMMSNKSTTDLDALRKITGDDTMTWKKYKLNRFDSVKLNLSRISYFDYNEVIDQFVEAFKTDGDNGNLTESTNIQTLIFGVIKRATNDFADGGIYKNSTISITSAEQLIKLTKENKMGSYRLDADIDFSNITVEDGEASYITNQFLGSLDGNGYEITGVKYPIFKNIVFSEIKDITIKNPEYAGNAEAVLAISSSNSMIDTIKVENSSLEIPMINTKSGIYYEYGKIEFTTKEYEINSLEDFLKIGDENNGGNKKKYNLNTDIDLSSITVAANTPILQTQFVGSINGNGHTISNLNATLFDSLNNSVIENLNIESGSIVLTATNVKGMLANSIQYSTINKVSIKGVSLASNVENYSVGCLAGTITNSTITQVSLEDIYVKACNTVGGIAGQLNNTTVENCIVTGTVQGTEWWRGAGARTGGITGWMSGGSITNCLTKVNIVAIKAGNGGLIGGPQTGNCIIKNSISLSTGTNANRISGWVDALGVVENIYEYEGSDSATQITDDTNTRIKLATETNIKDINFYKKNLGWSENIWNFDDLSSGNGPTLK